MDSLATALSIRPPKPVDFGDPGTTTLKKWAENYLADGFIVGASDSSLSQRLFKGFLGGHSMPDDIRLQSQWPRSEFRKEGLWSETDVTIWFIRHIMGPVLFAFQSDKWDDNQWYIRFETSPWNKVCFVDVYWGFQLGSAPVMVLGEHKRPNTIVARAWRDAKGVLDKPSQRLLKELRGYCHLFICEYIYAFDGMTLLILWFNTETTSVSDRKENLLSVKPIVWVFDHESGSTDGPTMRQVIYCLFRMGWEGLPPPPPLPRT